MVTLPSLWFRDYDLLYLGPLDVDNPGGEAQFAEIPTPCHVLVSLDVGFRFEVQLPAGEQKTRNIVLEANLIIRSFVTNLLSRGVFGDIRVDLFPQLGRETKQRGIFLIPQSNHIEGIGWLCIALVRFRHL